MVASPVQLLILELLSVPFYLMTVMEGRPMLAYYDTHFISLSEFSLSTHAIVGPS